MLQVVADHAAEPTFVAADLLSQAEHGVDSQVVLVAVSLSEEKLEAIEVDTTDADEATVRRLVKRENQGMGSWVSNIIGLSLFSVEEAEESDSADGELSDGEEETRSERSTSTRHSKGVMAAPEPQIPPPKSDEGGWQDAAWLLSVASKILL